MRVSLVHSRLALAAALTIGATAAARAAPQHCPARIEVRQTATDVPAGYQPFDSEPQHQWTNAQFSEGPPSEQAWLAPDTTGRQGKALVNTWTFVNSPEGIWLSCGYAGTSIVVARRLPDTIRRCEVRFDMTIAPPAATAIDCR